MAPRIRSTFSANLKRLRKEQKLSQERLALKAGIERAYMGLIERRKSSPTIDTLDKIARVLKVSPDELLKPPTK